MTNLCQKKTLVKIKKTLFYKKNTADFVSELSELDAAFSELETENKTLVMGDRFPFLYLAKEYNISYYAAFPGCAGESEPGASTVAALIDKVKNDNIPAVFYTEFSNQKVAKTICEATGAKPLILHSCHNVSVEDFENGESYLSLMYKNLANLKEAFNYAD